MTKPTSTIRTDATQTDRSVRGTGPTLCLALRLWGYEESEVQSWIEELHALHGAATWRISRERTAHGADLIVHLVKPSRTRDAAFCWNCAGANYALAQSPVGAIEMVLFEGLADQLPSMRAGHWAAAGSLSPQAALGRLGHLVAAASTPRSDRRAVVRRNLLCMITRQLDAA
ncbi:hypothetical protein PQR34_21765 [Paraburkholderia sediminicola]|uniref:hypothetical protein n=1 Tax=Paraburkholderia sediminicola TaxID=458836 RepID=UPI0038B8E33A